MTTKPMNEFESSLKAINEVNKIASSKDMQQNMRGAAKSLLQINEEKLDGLEANISKYTVEELENLPYEKIKELYMVNGKEMTINLGMEKDKEKEFKRDFLVYLRSISSNEGKIDEVLDEFKETLSEHEKEYSKLMESVGAMYILAQENMKDYMNNPDSTEFQKEEAKRRLEWMEYALTLEPLMKMTEEFPLESAIEDFKRPNSISISKYKSFIRGKGLKTDLTKLSNLEELLGLEEYKEFYNLTTFLAMRFVGYSKDKISKDNAGTFISQLALVYYSLAEGSIRPEDKETLKSSCETLLNKFKEIKK